jgi:hypothetical protein
MRDQHFLTRFREGRWQIDHDLILAMQNGGRAQPKC